MTKSIEWVKCSRCKQDKSSACFYRDSSKNTGFKSACKACENTSATGGKWTRTHQYMSKKYS